MENRYSNVSKFQGRNYGVILEALFNFEGPEKDFQKEEIWGYSSAGRAPALQAGGLRFDTAYLHHNYECSCNMGLVRTKR